jgi:hypothetical protein
LPASMCAMMPMFRVFANEDCRAIAVYFDYSLAGTDPRLFLLARGAPPPLGAVAYAPDRDS